MNRTRTLPTTLIALLAVALPALAGAAAHGAPLPAEYTGILLSSSGAVTVPVTLHVDSFSTPAEIARLSKELGDNGPRAVMTDLAAMPARGWIRVGDLIGFDVPVIREFPTPKGVKVFAVLDRPFPLFEQLKAIRSVDTPFGVVELTLDLNGNGNGTLYPASRVMFTSDGKVEAIDQGAAAHQIIGVTQQLGVK